MEITREMDDYNQMIESSWSRVRTVESLFPFASLSDGCLMQSQWDVSIAFTGFMDLVIKLNDLENVNLKFWEARR